MAEPRAGDPGVRDPQAELAVLTGLIGADPANKALLCHCARTANDAGDYERALQFCATAGTLGPTDAEPLFVRANALIGLQRFTEAREVLETLHQRGLQGSAMDIDRALCCYQLGEFKTVRDLLDGVLACGVSSDDVLRLAVSSRHHLGDLDGALALVDAYPAGADASAALLGTYALVHLDANRAAQARRCSAAALKRNPDNVDALIVAATVALARADMRAAEELYRRAQDLCPAAGRVWLGLGSIALMRRELPAARDLFQRGVERMPGHVGSWHALGWTCLMLQDIDEALRIFQHALELDRNFAETHGALAAIYALLGRVPEAQRSLTLAKRLDSQALSVHFAEAMLVRHAGNPERACALVQEVAIRVLPGLQRGLSKSTL